MRLFITATDTGAGKTYVAAQILRALRRAGADAVGMKPICAGDRDDALQLHDAADGVEPIEMVNPVWYRTPAAPYTAAMVEERPPDLDLIREKYRALCLLHSSVIIEGVGGWRVPITRDYSVADLAASMEAQVLLVVKNRLGAINHALLTAEAIRQRGLPLAGYVLNQPDASLSDEEMVATATNAGILADLLGFAPLFTLGPGEELQSLPRVPLFMPWQG